MHIYFIATRIWSYTIVCNIAAQGLTFRCGTWGSSLEITMWAQLKNYRGE